MREIYQQVREGLLCADCGETHPATLHFHHHNPQEKEFSIADFVRKRKSPEALLKEISKCIVRFTEGFSKVLPKTNVKLILANKLHTS